LMIVLNIEIPILDLGWANFGTPAGSFWILAT